MKNLKILKEMILQDSEIIKGKSSNIIEYLKEMKYFYSIIKRTEIFADSQEKKLKLSFIIAAYSNLLSMFWKMSKKNDYEFAFRYKDNILNKINELVEAEQIIYDDIVEYYKCKLKKLN